MRKQKNEETNKYLLQKTGVGSGKMVWWVEYLLYECESELGPPTSVSKLGMTVRVFTQH